MKTLFSTSHVHPRDRFDFWHSIACQNIVEHESTPECRQTFEAELKSGVLAEISLVLFENSPMAVSHTVRHADHANAEELLFCRQIAGRLTLEQDGRSLILGSGDMALLDPRMPYAGRFFAGSRTLVLKVSRQKLEARTGKTFELIARRLDPLDGINSLTSAFIAMLPAHADELAPLSQDIVESQALDLVALSLSHVTDRGKPRLSSARALILMKLRATIEAHLGDPGVVAETIAAAAGITVRYANKVLAEEGTSIQRLILQRRLERCRKVLEDPSQAQRTLSSIAYSWGFSDITHFGRKFREAYGMMPSAYRKEKLARRTHELGG